MRVQIAQPVASAQQLQGFLQSTMPQREHFSRGGHACVGDGLVTGIVVKPDGPNAVSLGWEIPNLGVKLLMVFAIVAGILPGLLLWGLVWMVISGDVERLKQETAAALTTGVAQAGGPMAMQAIPYRPGKPGGVAATFGVLFGLMAMGAFAYGVHMLDRASSADRYASTSSYSYGSRYSYGLGPSFWTSIARRRREEAYTSFAGGGFNLLVAIGLFALRGSKVRRWEAENAGAAPMMGMQPGYGQPMQPGYGQPMQPGYGQPMQPMQPMQPGYGQPMKQGYGQPMPPSGPNPFGPPQGQPMQAGFGPPPSGPNPYGPPQGQPMQGGFGPPSGPNPNGGAPGQWPPGGQGHGQG